MQKYLEKKSSKTTEETEEKQQSSAVRSQDIKKDLNENKTEHIPIKKQNPIKRITQIQNTPLTTSKKFQEFQEIEIEIKLHKSAKLKMKNPTNLNM